MLKKNDIYQCVAYTYTIHGKYIKIIGIAGERVYFAVKGATNHWGDPEVYGTCIKKFNERFKKVSLLKKLLIDWDTKEAEDIL